MMTRNEQRGLLESLADLKGLLPQVVLGEGEQRTLVEESLQSAAALCTSTLSPGRAAFYQELFGGMLTALQSASWDSMGTEQESEIRALLLELLDAAIREVRAEQEVKKIFIFLPYKASMWDSLESIWKAAADDTEHTEVHVVPIPYADRNPDGSAAAWHCEVDEFPDYVPVEDWRDYTLEQLKELRPDAIFIHNPYDANNFVTSIEAQYYSDRLKECTDCLVYVPYFVSGESVSRGTVITPGVMNADYVILESEDIREQYIAYTEPFGVNEKKFLALGSPKFDAVLSARKEDFSLPSAWEKILQGKKVVLFGTSLGAILQNTEHVCQKTREILAFFREHREIALWWRPHPLVRSTLKSMRGDVYEEYCQIEDEYKQAGWGIFDDSGDLDRAIAWSDAYYGNPSSVCTLFTAAEKPVVLQGYDPASPKMVTWHVDIGSESALFFEAFRGIFYDFDLKTGARISAVPLPRAYWHQVTEFGPFARHGEQVLLFPHRERAICTFDLHTGEMQTIGTAENVYASDGSGMSFRTVSYRDSIYCLGVRSNEILKYDFHTKELTHITEWFEPLRESFGLGHDHSVEMDMIVAHHVQGNILMAVIARSNLVLELGMDTDAWKLHEVGGKDQLWQDIDFDGTYYYLMGRTHTPVVRWNKETGEIHEYTEHLVLLKGMPEFTPFYFLECAGGELHLLRGLAGRSIAIDKETGEARFLEEDGGATYYKKKLGQDTYLRHVVKDATDALVFDMPEGRRAYPMTYDFLQDRIPLDQIGTKNGVYMNVLPLSSIPKLLEMTRKDKSKATSELAGSRIYRFVREGRA